MKIIAHRGDTKRHTENTLAAFIKAVEIGANGIELDVHLTADNKLVVFHNYDLRTLDKSLNLISDTNYSEIKKRVIPTNNSLTGENKIPLLEEVFENLKENTEYEIELKGYTKEFVILVIELVNKFKLLDRIEFTSSHISNLLYLKSIEHNSVIGYIPFEKPSWMDIKLYQEIVLNDLVKFEFNVLHMPIGLLDKKFVLSIHKLRKKVHAANCNTQESLHRANEIFVDQLTTDDLETALAYG